MEKAERAGIPSVIEKGGADLCERILGHLAGVDLVCLAGFMRLVKEPLLGAFEGRILNIHPSLLPRYPGVRAWEQAIADEATESGCTVHFVDAEKGMLFDLATDPNEQTNLWHDPAHAKTRDWLISEILNWRMESSLKTQGFIEACVRDAHAIMSPPRTPARGQHREGSR